MNGASDSDGYRPKRASRKAARHRFVLYRVPVRDLCRQSSSYRALALIEPVILDLDKSIMKYPNIKRFPGGASNDLKPDLQHPENPLPLLKDQKEPHVGGGGG